MTAIRTACVVLALLAGGGCATIDALDDAYRGAGHGPLISGKERLEAAAASTDAATASTEARAADDDGWTPPAWTAGLPIAPALEWTMHSLLLVVEAASAGR